MVGLVYFCIDLFYPLHHSLSYSYLGMEPQRVILRAAQKKCRNYFLLGIGAAAFLFYPTWQVEIFTHRPHTVSLSLAVAIPVLTLLCAVSIRYRYGRGDFADLRMIRKAFKTASGNQNVKAVLKECDRRLQQDAPREKKRA